MKYEVLIREKKNCHGDTDSRVWTLDHLSNAPSPAIAAAAIQRTLPGDCSRRRWPRRRRPNPSHSSSPPLPGPHFATYPHHCRPQSRPPSLLSPVADRRVPTVAATRRAGGTHRAQPHGPLLPPARPPHTPPRP